jgi:UrcA family protein
MPIFTLFSRLTEVGDHAASSMNGVSGNPAGHTGDGKMYSHKLNTARAVVALATIAASGVPSLALAQNVIHTEHVSYTDLDLQTSKGVSTLDHRLSRAIDRVCKSDDGAFWTSHEASDEMRCRKEVRMQVQPQRDLAIQSARDSQSRLASADSGVPISGPGQH